MRSCLQDLHKTLFPWLPPKKATTAKVADTGRRILTGINMFTRVRNVFSSGSKGEADGEHEEITESDEDDIYRASLGMRPEGVGSAATSPAGTGGSSGSGGAAGGGGGTGSGGGSENAIMGDAHLLLQKVEETGWLEHIRVVMASSCIVAEKLAIEGCGVLVHCSDGWDRTAQV